MDEMENVQTKEKVSETPKLLFEKTNKMDTFQLIRSRKIKGGLPWWSSGYDSMLPLQGAQGTTILKASWGNQKKKREGKEEMNDQY